MAVEKSGKFFECQDFAISDKRTFFLLQTSPPHFSIAPFPDKN